jgi:1-acyl-sn-glycerol-3-phosphate acyltransferase
MPTFRGHDPRSRYMRMRRSELADLARRREIPGRSRMNKAELAGALAAADLADQPAQPQPATALGTMTALLREPSPRSRERRRALYDRLAALTDPGRTCTWRSIEGHPCGLPVVTGADACALHGGSLHGGGDIVDMAIPLGGRLGFDTWPELLRQLWLASYEVDPIGLDPVIAEMVWHVLNGLYFDYFRVEVEGIEHVPMSGPAVLVGNHGGAALPYDAAMLMLAVANEAPLPRRVRVTATEIFNMLPWVSHLYRKAGAAYAARSDARFLLRGGHLLGVFPEGEKGFMKPVWQAYRVQRFGRGGFVELAEEAAAPIVPFAIIGSEEVHPAMFVSRRLARLVRMVWPEQRVDGIAVFLNPVPLPVRWKIRFLPSLPPESPGRKPDPLRLLERSEAVRALIQTGLDEMLAGRGSIF